MISILKMAAYSLKWALDIIVAPPLPKHRRGLSLCIKGLGKNLLQSRFTCSIRTVWLMSLIIFTAITQIRIRCYVNTRSRLRQTGARPSADIQAFYCWGQLSDHHHPDSP